MKSINEKERKQKEKNKELRKKTKERKKNVELRKLQESMSIKIYKNLKTKELRELYNEEKTNIFINCSARYFESLIQGLKEHEKIWDEILFKTRKNEFSKMLKDIFPKLEKKKKEKVKKTFEKVLIELLEKVLIEKEKVLIEKEKKIERLKKEVLEKKMAVKRKRIIEDDESESEFIWIRAVNVEDDDSEDECDFSKTIVKKKIEDESIMSDEETSEILMNLKNETMTKSRQKKVLKLFDNRTCITVKEAEKLYEDKYKSSNKMMRYDLKELSRDWFLDEKKKYVSTPGERFEGRKMTVYELEK